MCPTILWTGSIDHSELRRHSTCMISGSVCRRITVSVGGTRLNRAVVYAILWSRTSQRTMPGLMNVAMIMEIETTLNLLYWVNFFYSEHNCCICMFLVQHIPGLLQFLGYTVPSWVRLMSQQCTQYLTATRHILAGSDFMYKFHIVWRTKTHLSGACISQKAGSH